MTKRKGKKNNYDNAIIYYLCVFIPIICVIIAGCWFYFNSLG